MCGALPLILGRWHLPDTHALSDKVVHETAIMLMMLMMMLIRVGMATGINDYLRATRLQTFNYWWRGN